MYNYNIQKRNFEEILKSLREEKGLTQDELAHELGFESRQSVAKWESGKMPTSETLWSYAKYFDVSIEYLLGISPYKHPENEKISELTRLSDTACETLRRIKETGDNRYIFILDLLLSDEEIFSELMKNLVSLVFPSSFGFMLDRIPINCLSEDGKMILLNPEQIKIISDEMPDTVFHRIRSVLEDFANRNKDKEIIAPNEYHPLISMED